MSSVITQEMRLVGAQKSSTRIQKTLSFLGGVLGPNYVPGTVLATRGIAGRATDIAPGV